MITENQVIGAIAVFYKSGNGYGGMRKALEAYEKSKWVTFDVGDASTYPPIMSGSGIFSENVVTNGRDIARFCHSTKTWCIKLPSERCEITHWQPLPTFKE
jgi:hypothetical protein